jgi:hypothetical protein
MFADADPKPKASIETRCSEFQRAILSTTDRISLVPRQEALLEERIGVLAALPFIPPVGREADGIATRANWKPTTVQLAFLGLLRRNARDTIHSPQAVVEFSGRRRAATGRTPAAGAVGDRKSRRSVGARG